MDQYYYQQRQVYSFFLFRLVIHCPPLPTWESYEINTTDTIYGTGITVTCTETLHFPDNDTSMEHTCLHTSTWYPELQKCLGL